MNQRNYQKELERILNQLMQGGIKRVPTLFLHACCAPCSSYCLEYLAPYFQITVFYFNPNISASEEYLHRVREEKRLIELYNQEKKGHEIKVLEGDWQPAAFYEAVRGFENCKEGGERCFRCYELRLRETALQAKARGFDYFGTTLTISPLKNAEKLNEIGERLSAELSRVPGAPEESRPCGGTPKAADDDSRGERQLLWLPSDFKKKGGYQRSIELSKQYGLYRQDFCGCSFSKAQREIEKQAREEKNQD